MTAYNTHIIIVCTVYMILHIAHGTIPSLPPLLPSIPSLPRSPICSGYVNPITQFEYPRTEVMEGGMTLNPIVRLYFSWQPPEVLGGLNEDDILYRVRLITDKGETVADELKQDLHFERNFSGIHNITARMSIYVTAEPHGSDYSSQPTHIPDASVLDCKSSHSSSSLCVILSYAPQSLPWKHHCYT